MADELNMGEMRKSGNSKLNEILRRSRGDNEISDDTPDIYFDYADSDTYQGEMAELYSYTEEDDFAENKENFHQLFQARYPEGTLWWSLSDLERRNEVFRLVNLLEVANKKVRSQAMRALLYLVQGTFAECRQKPVIKRAATYKHEEGAENVAKNSNKNECNKNNTNNNAQTGEACNSAAKQDPPPTNDNSTTPPVETTQISQVETNNSNNAARVDSDNNSTKNTASDNNNNKDNNNATSNKNNTSLNEHTSYVARNTALLYHCGVFHTCTQLLNMEINSKPVHSGGACSLSDNKDLRFLLSILYTMLESMRHELTPELSHLKDDLKTDLVTCLSNPNESSLILTLFTMVTTFCESQPCHYPVKKVLLLLWKSLLLILGGLDEAFAMKNEKRKKAGLPPLLENPHEVCRNMRASSPPGSAVDLIEQHQLQRRSGKAALRKQAASRQGSMEEDSMVADEDGLEGVRGGFSDDDGLPSTPPRPASPQLAKGLPWAPKVRKKDLENFLDQTRSKFLGFQVNDDVTSLFGLPYPIHEGVEVFKQRLYVSLSEVQTKQEEDLAKNPLSMTEGQVEQSSCEILYQAIYQSLPNYNIALLKILLAAAPTSKDKSDNINILVDLFPEKMPSSVLHSMKLGIDVNRHKEVIVKSISSLLILLLKHFKINHFYQFEFMAQHLVFANCIPLVLKFLNQNILAHICAKNNISILDYPSCVIGDPPELNADSLEAGDNEEYCWRNLFSSINLLRVLNKITKWKHSRVMLLVVFKSAPILKRVLKVRQPMHQMYVLKLLKMQTKYLGRQWRKNNMKSMSAIYQKVRHRLNDDWAYGNDVDARPWDFQSEESVAKMAIDQFNNRRYQTSRDDPSTNNNATGGVSSSLSILHDFTPVDNCLQSVLNNKVELSREFEENYEEWLECEVFAQKIDWNQFLTAAN